MDWLGRIYEVGTVSLESERTASVTVTVTDDPSKVTEAYRGAARIQLGKAGEAKTFGFNPGSSEAQFKFSGDLVPLNSVKVNGKAVAPDTPESLSHIITVADGDKIEITASYPEIEVPFTINVPEEVAGVVRSLKRNLGGYYNYENLDFTPNEPVMVPAGSCLEIEFNTSDYNLKSAKIGDYDLNPSGAKIFVLNDMVDVDLDAALWGVFNVTINLTDPSQVKVYPGEYPDVEPYALVAGANNVELDERKGAIFIKAESGFQINGVTDENGNLCEGQGNVYKVTRNGWCSISNPVNCNMTASGCFGLTRPTISIPKLIPTGVLRNIAGSITTLPRLDIWFIPMPRLLVSSLISSYRLTWVTIFISMVNLTAPTNTPRAVTSISPQGTRLMCSVYILPANLLKI